MSKIKLRSKRKSIEQSIPSGKENQKWRCDRPDPDASIQEQKYAVYRILPLFKSFCWLSQIALLNFNFVRRSFLGVRTLKKIKESDIKIFGLVLYWIHAFL